MNETQKMIKNYSVYPLTEIYEYLAGYTTKLTGKILIKEVVGEYYDTIIILNNTIGQK